MTGEHPIVLFDGTCGFCHAGVRWLIDRDRAGRLRFAPLQSPTGQRLLGEHGLPSDWDQSLVLVADGRASTFSTGSLRICGYLPLPWKLCAVGLLVPRFVRDAVYRIVARNRRRLPGRRDESCAPPAPLARSRMLDEAA